MNKNREIFILGGSDRIVSMLYIKEDIISSSTYYFCTGKSVSKDMENIKDIIDDSVTFKEEVGRNETISNKIQTIISLCKENLEAVI